VLRSIRIFKLTALVSQVGKEKMPVFICNVSRVSGVDTSCSMFVNVVSEYSNIRPKMQIYITSTTNVI
jgi:hypothetical protein